MVSFAMLAEMQCSHGGHLRIGFSIRATNRLINLGASLRAFTNCLTIGSDTTRGPISTRGVRTRISASACFFTFAHLRDYYAPPPRARLHTHSASVPVGVEFQRPNLVLRI